MCTKIACSSTHGAGACNRLRGQYGVSIFKCGIARFGIQTAAVLPVLGQRGSLVPWWNLIANLPRVAGIAGIVGVHSLVVVGQVLLLELGAVRAAADVGFFFSRECIFVGLLGALGG